MSLKYLLLKNCTSNRKKTLYGSEKGFSDLYIYIGMTCRHSHYGHQVSGFQTQWPLHNISVGSQLSQCYIYILENPAVCFSVGEIVSKRIVIEMSVADFVSIFSSDFFSPCCFV